MLLSPDGLALRAAEDHITKANKNWHCITHKLFRVFTVVSAFLISKKQILKLSEIEFGAPNFGDLCGHAFRGDAHPTINHTDINHGVGRSREE
jgi:hypothetical protein